MAVVRVAAPLVVGAVLALAPVPQGLSPNAWRYFALFAAVIVGVIAEPIPAATVGLAGVVTAAVLGLVHPSTAQATSWALSGFANNTVWLIFAAYMLALGYSKTGLGKRIALVLIRAMGKRTLGLGYAIALADLVLAPFTPSNTARSGGTIYPIISNIPELYGSRPGEESARKIGGYLMFTALAATCVTSCMFATAMAPNVLAISLIAKTIDVTISWGEWAKGFAPVGIPLFILTPFLLYKIYPPEIKESPDAPIWANRELREMGPITRKEITLLAIVITALALWIGGAKYIDSGLAAIAAVVLMVVLRVVSWNDVLGYSQAWNVLVWFATLVTLAGGLAETKFVDWVALTLAPSFSAFGTTTAILLVLSAFFFLHYFFASGTAYVSALLPVFLGVAVKIPGLSPKAWALLLAYTVGLSSIVTPYAGGPCPIYYASGYVKSKDFWVLGTILGLVFFVVYVAIAVPWMIFLDI